MTDTETKIFKDLMEVKDNPPSDYCFDDFISKHIYTCSLGDIIRCFILMWGAIPKQYLYETYKYCLSACDPGRNYYNEFFKADILDEILLVNKHDTVNNSVLQALVDEKGCLTIYHGHCKKTLRGSNSWTLNKDTAKWFGNRNALMKNSSTYYVVTGKAFLKDIIAYITDRTEQEILVLNKNVINKTKEFFEKS